VNLCTKFQVSSSTRLADMLGCTPKFMGVPCPRPRPFSRFFFALRVFDTLQLCICVPNFKSLGLLAKFMGSRDLGQAPFSRFFFALQVFETLQLCICVPNFTSLGLLVLEIR